MTAHQAVHPIATMCRVLGVSPSGYYAWRERPLSRRARADMKLSAEIQAIHRESRGTYGVPRIERHFTAAGPDQLWVADITYVPTWAGSCIWPSSSMRGVAA